MPDSVSVDYHFAHRLSSELATARSIINHLLEKYDIEPADVDKAQSVCDDMKSSEKLLDEITADESCYLYEL